MISVLYHWPLNHQLRTEESLLEADDTREDSVRPLGSSYITRFVVFWGRGEVWANEATAQKFQKLNNLCCESWKYRERGKDWKTFKPSYKTIGNRVNKNRYTRFLNQNVVISCCWEKANMETVSRQVSWGKGWLRAVQYTVSGKTLAMSGKTMELTVRLEGRSQYIHTWPDLV